jgi:hypothetical protein
MTFGIFKFQKIFPKFLRLFCNFLNFIVFYVFLKRLQILELLFYEVFPVQMCIKRKPRFGIMFVGGDSEILEKAL